MDRIVPALLLLLVAAGLGYAGLRGVRGRAFWLPSIDDSMPDVPPRGIAVAERYARPAGALVLIGAALLAVAAIRMLLHA